MAKIKSCSFVLLVKEAFRQRTGRNPKYSLRAFARDLQLEPSLLSKILRNQYPITEAMLRRIASNLGYSETEIEQIWEDYVIEKQRRLVLHSDDEPHVSNLNVNVDDNIRPKILEEVERFRRSIQRITNLEKEDSGAIQISLSLTQKMKKAE